MILLLLMMMISATILLHMHIGCGNLMTRSV